MSGWVYWPVAIVVGLLLIIGWTVVLPLLGIQSELVRFLISVGVGYLIGQLLLIGWYAVEK